MNKAKEIITNKFIPYIKNELKTLGFMDIIITDNSDNDSLYYYIEGNDNKYYAPIEFDIYTDSRFGYNIEITYVGTGDYYISIEELKNVFDEIKKEIQKNKRLKDLSSRLFK